MKKAIIAGNHLITKDSITFETKSLQYGQSLLNNETDDLIIFFDQIGVKTLDVIDTYKSLPLAKKENFSRINELPELPNNIRLIFENSLRNYSRGVIKLGRQSALQKNMFHDDEDHIKCSCVGILISLVEILFKKYDEVIFVVEKQSKRVRVYDILKVKTAIPALKLVWI